MTTRPPSSSNESKNNLTKLRTSFILTELNYYATPVDDHHEATSGSSAFPSDLTKPTPYASTNQPYEHVGEATRNKLSPVVPSTPVTAGPLKGFGVDEGVVEGIVTVSNKVE